MTIYTAESLHTLDDAAFNRVIAQMEGFTLIPAGDDYDDHVWLLDDPRSDQRWLFAHGDTADEAWAYVLSVGVCDVSGGMVDDMYQVPRYTSDLNAAWGLFDESDESISWDVGHNSPEKGNFGRIVAITQSGNDFRTYVAWHANPARALATAWLLWKQENAG